jgi:hypothetical protein
VDAGVDDLIRARSSGPFATLTRLRRVEGD